MEIAPAAIFTGSIALIVFAATQMTLHIRDQKQFRREKLEELFRSLNVVSAGFLDVFRSVAEEDENKVAVSFRQLDQTLYEPRMLLCLYYPFGIDSWQNSIVTKCRAFGAGLNAIGDVDKVDQASLKGEVDRVCLEIRSFQNFIADNQKKIIGTTWRLLSPFSPEEFNGKLAKELHVHLNGKQEDEQDAAMKNQRKSE